MIFIFQAAVIISSFFIILVTLGNRSTHSGKAWKKIAFILLAVCMVTAVLFPEMLNNVAHIIGIGRGADLILYVLVVAFILYALNSYLQQQDQRDALYRLARKVAIVDANERYDIRKKK